MADIFISYSSVDRGEVVKLVSALSAAGYSVWYDSHLAGGSIFSAEIEREIKEAGAVLAVWTEASVQSRWVADEAELGRDREKLVPLTLDGSTPPLGFRQYQAINLADWDKTVSDPAFEKLKESLTRLGVKAGAPGAPIKAKGGETLDVPLTVSRPFVDRRVILGLAGGAGAILLGLLAFFLLRYQAQAPVTPAVVEAEPPAPQSVVVKAKRLAENAPSVAVLPFVNMSRDPDNEYFSDGITEEILNALTALPGLRVTSRTSSFAFKKSNLDLPSIARALGVSYIIEGSVRKADNQVRITVQLIRAEDDAHLWSETYDRELTEIFRIQEEISLSIAETLSVKLLGRAEPTTRTVDPVAYDIYLRGIAALETTAFDNIDPAIADFREATRIDPTLADAYAREAQALAFSVSTGKNPAIPHLALAEQAAMKALAIEPDNPSAEAALGLKEFVSGDLLAAIDRYGRAEQGHGLGELDYWFYAHALSDAGNLSEAMEMLQRNLKRDPLNAGLHFGLGMTYDALGEADKALDHYTRATDFEPENGYYLGWRSLLVGTQLNDPPSAIRMMHRAIALDPADPELYSILSFYYYTIEDYPHAESYLKASFAVAPRHSHSRGLAAQYARLRGDTDEAVAIADALLMDQEEFRFGALRDALEVVSLGDRTPEELIGLYYEKSDTLAAFRETGSLSAVALVNTPPAFLAVDLAALLRKTGEDRLAFAMTGWAREHLGPRQYSQFPGYQVIKAEALAVEGKNDQALESLEEIVASETVFGWQWRLRDNPHFAALKDRPRFKALLDLIEARNAGFRAELAELPPGESPTGGPATDGLSSDVVTSEALAVEEPLEDEPPVDEPGNEEAAAAEPAREEPSTADQPDESETPR